MPGIIGLVSNEGLEQHQGDLERMISPMLRVPSLCVDRAVGEHFALGNVTVPAAGSGMAHRDGIWLAYFGLIVEGHTYTPPAEPGRGDPQEPQVSIAEDLLLRYQAGGLPAVCGLNGYYALAIWEEAPRRMTLVKDRLGYTNMYYWHAPGQRLMFASEYKSIFWHPQFKKTINPVAVADVVVHRLIVGGRTLFQDIYNLPPAGILIYEDGEIHVGTYWQPAIFEPNGPVKRDEDYADEMARYMSESVRRRIRPANCMWITSGLDSRIIAGSYHKIAPGVELATTTVGLPTGDDEVVGRVMSEKLGYPHYHVPLGDEYLARYGAQAAWLWEGKNGAYASWILAQVPFLYQNHYQYAMSGVFGNFISGRHYPRPLVTAQTSEESIAAALLILEPYLGHMKEIMRPDVFQTAGVESADYIRQVFTSAAPTDRFQKFDWTILYWRIGYTGNTATVVSDVSLALEPFLDNDLFDYATGSVPPEVRARALFYHQMIVRHLPEVASVPYGRTGYSVNTDLMIQKNPALAWLEDKRRRALRRINPRRSEMKACIPQADAIRLGSREFVERYLSRDDILGDYFDMRALRNMLDDHLSGRRNMFMALDGVLTFALWYEQFCNLGKPLPEAAYAFQTTEDERPTERNNIRVE